jgi:hypothetical protein
MYFIGIDSTVLYSISLFLFRLPDEGNPKFFTSSRTQMLTTPQNQRQPKICKILPTENENYSRAKLYSSRLSRYDLGKPL